MANEKKWYNLFVSVDESASGADAADQAAFRPPPGGSENAAQAIADIAASVQPVVDQRVEQRMQQTASAMPPLPGGAAAALGKTMSFNEIYGAAEIIQPAHGYTILKVAEMLDSPHIKELPAEVKRSSVLVALDAAGVKVQEIVEDAVRRDKALDAFERVHLKQIEDAEAAKLEENRKLQAELDRMTAEYKAKIQANNDATAKRKEAFYSWRVDKQKVEQKIADTVSYFVTDNPITTSTRPSPPTSGKPGI